MPVPAGFSFGSISIHPKQKVSRSRHKDEGEEELEEETRILSGSPATSTESREQEAEQVARVLMSAPQTTEPLKPDSRPGVTHAAKGKPLSEALRNRFEGALGRDLSRVRLHTGADAWKAADSLGAKAFTRGHDIAFGRKVGDPESYGNLPVLAHEIAHVVQQEGGQSGAGPASTARQPLVKSISAAPPGSTQTLPSVTAVNAPGELGVGRNADATATVAAGAGAITWTLVGAPAGITITRRGATRARVQAPNGPAAHAAAGGTFQIQAALTANPADNALSGLVTFVGIPTITYAATPAFAAQPIAGGGVAPFPPGPPGTADPNRDGIVGNTAVVNVVTAPAGRPTTVTLRTSLGSTVAGNIITLGRRTGNMVVRVTDNATRARRDDINLVVNPVPLRLNAFTAQAAGPGAGAGVYGPINTIGWRSSDATGVLNRVVGETITAGGRDDFNITASVNAGAGGPNPAPIAALAVPANAWNDQLLTGISFVPPAPPPGLAAGVDVMDINNYVGAGAPARLPRVWILRQGFHYQSWTGAWSTEFDHGIHRRSLVRRAGAFGFLTEHVFPGARAAPFFDAYAGPPLITLSAFTVTPAAPPAAGGLAADGVATANITVATTVAGRNVTWTAIDGPLAVTVPAAGAAAAVGAPATVRAGLVPGRMRVRVADSVFTHRNLTGRVRVLPVRVRRMRAAPRRVPAGVLTSTITVQADPGGRVINWAVDAASAAAGVTVVGVAPAAGAIQQTATVTRPAGFTGNVSVTASDSILPGENDSTRVRFL